MVQEEETRGKKGWEDENMKGEREENQGELEGADRGDGTETHGNVDRNDVGEIGKGGRGGGKRNDSTDENKTDRNERLHGTSTQDWYCTFHIRHFTPYHGTRIGAQELNFKNIKDCLCNGRLGLLDVGVQLEHLLVDYRLWRRCDDSRLVVRTHFVAECPVRFQGFGAGGEAGNGIFNRAHLQFAKISSKWRYLAATSTVRHSFFNETQR